MPPKNTAEPVGIDPDTLYRLKAFQAASGIGDTLRIQARKAGIELPLIKAGRNHYVEGRDGIEYVRQLAKWQAASK